MTTEMRKLNHPRFADAFRTHSTIFWSVAMSVCVARIANATRHSRAPEITYQATLISKEVESQFLAINESGHVAGVRISTGGESSFLYRDGAITELMRSGGIDPKLSGGNMLRPKALDDKDEVLVAGSDDGSHPMVWANGKYREVGPIPTKIGDRSFSKNDLKFKLKAYPIGFTNSGKVLVDLFDTGMVDGALMIGVFLWSGDTQRVGQFDWSDNTMTQLIYHLEDYPEYPPRPIDFGPIAVNEHGDIVGMTDTGGGPMSMPSKDDKSFVVIWSRDKGTISSIPSSAAPVAMNNHDQWIGNTFGSTPEGSPYTHACRSSPKGDKVVELENPANLQLVQGQKFISSQAYAINDNGDIVGTAGGEAVLWRGSDGKALNLNDLIPSGGNIHLESARGINSRGQIVALTNRDNSGGYGGSVDAYLLTPVKQ